jgi:hypothetical protein
MDEFTKFIFHVSRAKVYCPHGKPYSVVMILNERNMRAVI